VAHRATSRGRNFRCPGNNFPILFEDSTLVVYTNGSGEIFVERKSDDKVTIRVTPDHNDLTVTAAQARLTPWSVNGLPAFRVTSRG
jgi:hypothetical protein